MKKKIGWQNKEPLGSSSIMVLDKRRKKGGWSWAGFAKPRPSSSIVPRRTGGSLWSTWEWRDWLQPKERKKQNKNNPEHIRVNAGLRGQLPDTGIQTLTVHVHIGRCFLRPLFSPTPRGNSEECIRAQSQKNYHATVGISLTWMSDSLSLSSSTCSTMSRISS